MRLIDHFHLQVVQRKRNHNNHSDPAFRDNSSSTSNRVHCIVFWVGNVLVGFLSKLDIQMDGF